MIVTLTLVFVLLAVCVAFVGFLMTLAIMGLEQAQWVPNALVWLAGIGGAGCVLLALGSWAVVWWQYRDVRKGE